jgi:hypothetical protein
MVAPRRGARTVPLATGGIAPLNHRLIAPAPSALTAALIAATQSGHNSQGESLFGFGRLKIY